MDFNFFHSSLRARGRFAPFGVVCCKQTLNGRFHDFFRLYVACDLFFLLATAKSAVRFRPGQPGSIYSNRAALVVFACSTTVLDQQCVRSRVASGKLIDVWHVGICFFCVCSCSCFRLLHRCIVHAVGLLPVFFVCAQYHANDHGIVRRRLFLSL